MGYHPIIKVISAPSNFLKLSYPPTLRIGIKLLKTTSFLDHQTSSDSTLITSKGYHVQQYLTPYTITDNQKNSRMADQRESPATKGCDETKQITSEDAAVTITTNSFNEVLRYFDSNGDLINKATKIAIPCAICQLEDLALCNFDIDKGLGATNEPYLVLPRCGHAFGGLCFAEVSKQPSMFLTIPPSHLPPFPPPPHTKLEQDN